MKEKERKGGVYIRGLLDNYKCAIPQNETCVSFKKGAASHIMKICVQQLSRRSDGNLRPGKNVKVAFNKRTKVIMT